MKIFSKRTNPQIQTIEQLIERQTRLTFMRSEAQVALDAALADRQGHLVGGDFEDESIAEAMQVRADKAQAALVGLDDAIAALTIQIGNAQEAQTAELRRIKAESDAKELAAVVSKVEKLLPAWIATAREMSGLLDSLNNFRYQVGGVANYLGSVAVETEAGLKVILDDLIGAVGPIARGEQTIRIGKPAPSPAPSPAPARKDIFEYSAHPRGPTYRVPDAFSKEKR